MSKRTLTNHKTSTHISIPPGYRAMVLVAVVAMLALAGCGTANNAATKAVISSPLANADFLSNAPIQIQGQADGAGIVRVDIIIDATVLTAVAAADTNNGVASLPVSVPYKTQTIGTHFVQLKVYGAGEKLLAVSDPTIFVIKLAPEAPTTVPQPPTATPAPTPVPAPTSAPVVVTDTATTSATLTTTTTVTTVDAGNVAPSLTITNEFANVRSGPGTTYDLIGKLNLNETAPVRGKNAASDGVWWQIAFDKGPNGVGWVRGDLVSANAAAQGIAPAAAPPSPTAQPTQPPAPEQPTALPPTAVLTTVAVLTPTPSGPLCDASVKDWRGQNPSYPFCAGKDPTWADPNSEYTVYDNGRDVPLSISWRIYGENVKSMWIHFDQDNTGMCGFNKATQKTINQQVSPEGTFAFNALDFVYGGTMRVWWQVVLTDGRVVTWGEKKLCIR